MPRAGINNGSARERLLCSDFDNGTIEEIIVWISVDDSDSSYFDVA